MLIASYENVLIAALDLYTVSLE